MKRRIIIYTGVWAVALSALLHGRCRAQTVNGVFMLENSFTSVSTQLLNYNDSLLLNYTRWDIDTDKIHRGWISFSTEGIIGRMFDYSIPGRNLYPGFRSLLLNNDFIYISSQSGDSAGTVRSHLYKCTSEGDTVWTREYESSTGFLGARSLIAHPEGGFVLLGIVKEQVANESDIFILRTDTAGNELWRKIWGMPGRSEEIIDVKHIGNEEYIAGGGVRIYPPNYPNDDLYYRGLLIKFRNNGSVLSKEMGRPLQTEWLPGYFLESESGEIVAPSYISDDAINSDQRKGIMFSLDTALNITSVTHIENDFESFGLGNILALNDGNYLFWGSKGTISPVVFQSALFIKTTPGGEIIWRRTYSYPGSEISVLADAVELPDGSLVMCGQTRPPQKIWFVRTDEYGCLVPGCQYIGVEDVSSPDFAVKVYPNPVAELLYIFNPSAENLPAKLKNLGGKAVKTELMLPASGTFILPLTELTAGIYFLQITLPDGKVVTEKIIKQ